ncbi:solute carrier family 25 member 33 isoform X1 [Orcinus orca]|uniref:Solute carrier family 25 member 33 isoform X1 n=2 Tax=Odontoceti TaxID=9722 RepID=A0A6J3QBQ3_TURTR|nr:solute carrier family 25 member 33 isoform X1 [Orcinus orca]XP_033699587.1 solute carrier family 25 member 33 isoform X1 [Tursiops truncatus]
MATGSQQKENTLLHLFAGGCGGTVGAIFTCPLEVIKTRLQSSRLALRTVYYPQVHLGTISGAGMVRPTSVTPGLLQVLKTEVPQRQGLRFVLTPEVPPSTENAACHTARIQDKQNMAHQSILEKEGPKSLFRGLGPNLVGVAPSRAVYFACYSKAKEQFNGIFVPNSNTVHIFSAGSAAFVTNSLMNPIWMVKTRMQLERKVRGSKQMNTLQCARYVYQTEGIRGFYRGLTASYAGISETIICFAIYENLKKYLKEAPLASSTNGTEKNSTNFFGLMAAAALSKGCASCVAYPHEVIRTRLREEGTKYKSFVQTARLVFREEGYLAFYRGLFAQLIRQIPNTAIVLSTYELIVYLLEDHAQ